MEERWFWIEVRAALISIVRLIERRWKLGAFSVNENAHPKKPGVNDICEPASKDFIIDN